MTHSQDEASARQGEWRTFDTMPDVGRKFIALYNDGSGAAMYFRHDGGFIDQDGNEYDAPKWVNYDRWTYLPDLEFYCENCPEDPITLWVPPRPAENGAAVCQGSEADTAQGNLPPDEPILSAIRPDGGENSPSCTDIAAAGPSACAAGSSHSQSEGGEA